MSLATLEREIAWKVRDALNNQKLRVKDILEWSTSEIKQAGGEVVIYLPPPMAVYVAVLKEHDKRKPKPKP